MLPLYGKVQDLGSLIVVHVTKLMVCFFYSRMHASNGPTHQPQVRPFLRHVYGAVLRSCSKFRVERKLDYRFLGVPYKPQDDRASLLQ